MVVTPPVLAPFQSPYTRHRRFTRVVMVGDVGVGGDHPIRLQSMTTTRTLDTAATVNQIVRLVDTGCEIARVTAPTVADARNLGEIRRVLRHRGVRVPLVADIHFSPAAALEAALHVEKVRINPGNYADSKVFARREYTDAEYQAELERIEARFAPVVVRCREQGVAMRIGTNHGSLSDRIMNRFGDTPVGMVESALEFLAICERHGYQDVIFSMKASNPRVMVQAYRLLAARLDATGRHYPLHLGVTEAGDGEDGRVKSAVGIATLLADGLGDTIRVSLTEEPEREIPVASAIAVRYEGLGDATAQAETPPFDPFAYSRRSATGVALGSLALGGDAVPSVLAEVTVDPAAPAALLSHLRRLFQPLSKRVVRPDGLVARLPSAAARDTLGGVLDALGRSGPAPVVIVAPASADLIAPLPPHSSVHGIVAPETWTLPSGWSPTIARIVPVDTDDPDHALALSDAETDRSRCVLVSGSDGDRTLVAVRRLAARNSGIPILIRLPPKSSGDPHTVNASIALGAPLIDGIGDGAVVAAEDLAAEIHLAFGILQATGARTTRTDYVACPSCGRTLFDLQTTTARIRARTDHLVGVRIAIMGCIVNGPGEMADAHFGYVGGAPGQVNLYVGRECVERAVPEAQADERLIALIKSHGRWVDPEPD
ncbi:MAG: (E)-4-hydroxy-3-methylbut-2-enyl-diphosphate synthase [Chloroflexi bacterium]|nr:(E)-4-hydroxy-3-methylbut-2-enyl-diphosphate synthase [Chloroflexota bacterium]